ncbi:MAG: hypothetical protein AAFU67_18555, partial [Bacteroidota bacterium]
MPNNVRWLKSQPIVLSFSSENIDEENGVISDVVMCETGPAKGHGYHLEQSFIDGLAAYSEKYYNDGSLGLKARFGHPSLSDTTMGSQMGYFRNIRVREHQVIANLHLLDSAELSPKAPQMRSWMLSMAKEAPEFVMSSIVFSGSGYYQYNPETSERVELDFNEYGQPVPAFENERIYVDFKEDKGAKWYYTDLVEAGAATNSLFSANINKEKFAVRAAEFVRENADIHLFLKKHPEK